MAITTLGQTANFVINYLDSPTLPNAKRRAQALLDNVESDFSTIMDWFGVDSSAFGNANRVTVQVQTDSLASNKGYKTGGNTFISVDSQEGAGTDVGDDAVLSLFIAEFSEVLMSYRAINKSGKWNAADSNGEGLSVFCAGLMHPKGYYGASLGPRVNTWLTSNTRNDSAHNWISTVESTDKDADSYSCALLFIYYLYDQLGYSIRDIVVKGGDKLVDTYQNLTGNTGGDTTFKSLLDTYFPVGKIGSLATDDPFPLLPASQRRVELTFAQSIKGTMTESSHGDVVISPYIGCPAKDYHYTISNTPQLVNTTATVYGFAEPKYSWKVNGQSIDYSRVITTTTTVLLDNPGDPAKPTSTTQTLDILCTPRTLSQTYQAPTGGLDLYVYGTPGHVMVNVECAVTEQYATGTGATTVSKFDTIDQRTLTYEPQYYTDRDQCRAAFWGRVRDISNRYARSKHLFIWQTLPDPPEELVQAVAIIEETRSALAEIESQHPREARLLRSMVAGMLHASPALFAGDGRRAVSESPAVEERIAESVTGDMPV
jgi:hypothetical protein